MSLAGNVIAEPTYDSAGELFTVDYPNSGGGVGNGTSLAVHRDAAGAVDELEWTLNGSMVTDAVTRSQSGRVVDQTINGTDPYVAGDNYVYDDAGRLTTARVSGHTYTYGYAAPTLGDCPSPANLSAHKNTNRTSMSDSAGGGTIKYCYDTADRLISTTEAGVGIPTYDTHGNTTSIWGETRTYDGADRHLTTSKSGTTVTYGRDALDRIVSRSDGTTTIRYGSAGTGDSPDYTLDASSNVIESTISLPGGVLYTDTTTTDTWSYPNIHGDIVAVANNTGVKQAAYSYDPYGNTLSGVPDNTAGSIDYGWLGQHQRPLA